MMFMQYDGTYLKAESQVDFTGDNSALGKDFVANPSCVFEIESFGFGIENIVTIGSQSSGAGAGKVVFKPFHIDRRIDKSSPLIYEKCCAGTSFKRVALGFRKSSGGETSGLFFLRFDFKLVAAQGIDWSHDDESPKEGMDFMYGGLIMRYAQQNPDGSLMAEIPGGWNRVKNIKDQDVTADITTKS
jgi:type VI secretion system Hcp family effector